MRVRRDFLLNFPLLHPHVDDLKSGLVNFVAFKSVGVELDNRGIAGHHIVHVEEVKDTGLILGREGWLLKSEFNDKFLGASSSQGLQNGIFPLGVHQPMPDQGSEIVIQLTVSLLEDDAPYIGDFVK